MKTPLVSLLTLALLPLPAGALTRTFDGGGANTNWSTTANWTPVAAPVAGDSLVFITGITSSNNDISAGTVFRDLDFNARHTLTGNAFTLTHGITASMPTGAVTIAQAVTLNADQTFAVTSGTMTCDGNLLLNGRLLTANVSDGDTLALEGTITGAGAASRIVKSGNGTLRIASIAANVGGFTVNAGILDVPGTITGNTITLTDGKITGNGSLPTVNATDGEIMPTGGDLSVTGPLTLGPAVKYTVTFTGPGAENVLSVSGGAVNLNDAELVIDTSAYQPLWDEDFTLLTKGTSGAVTGTFKNLPQGAEVQVNATTIGRISYTGGNGNDVTLDIISTTRIWDGGNTLNDNWDEADNWALNTRPNFGDVLVFPTGIQSTDRGVDNNFPTDTTFRQLVFTGDDFTVRGNRFRLTHGIKLGSEVHANLDTSVVLAQDQIFEFEGSFNSLHLDLLDEINTAGHTLSLSGDGTIDGKIRGTGGVHVTAGSSIRFTAPNDYTGTTVIDPEGELQIDKAFADFGSEALLGTTASGTTAGGKLIVRTVVNAVRYKVDEPVTLLAGGEIQLTAPAISPFSVTDIEYAGPIVLQGPGTMTIYWSGFDAAKNAISSVISGSGDLMMSGSMGDPIELTGPAANTFTGSLTVSGMLRLDKSNPGVLAVPCASLIVTGEDAFVETRQDEQIADNCHVQVLDGAVLSIGNITARSETIGSLTFDGSGPVVTGGSADSNLVVTGNITQTGAGCGTIALDTMVTAPLTLVNVAGSLQFSADAATITRAGSAIMRKTGSGILELPGNQVSVPIQIAAGSLLFRAVNTQPIFLDGGNLIGNGTASGGLTSLPGGGFIQPLGEPSATAILPTGPLNLNAATTLQMQVLSAAAGTGFDQLSATGSVGLGGATLSLEYLAGFNVALGQSIVLLANDGSDAIIGTFAGLPQGTFIPVPAGNGGGGWTLSYTGGTGNDVVLTRVVTPPVEVQAVVTTVTFGAADVHGNRPVTIAGKGTPGASYRLENSVNLSVWTPEGTAQTAAPTTGALSFTTSASPPVRLKQFWRFRKL